MSRGLLDVNNPEMLRRAFILKHGQYACSSYLQLADPIHGFKFYKNTLDYSFQWEKPEHWDTQFSSSTTNPDPGLKSQLQIQSELEEKSLLKNRPTPQKILVNMINTNKTYNLPKTRLLDSNHFSTQALDDNATTSNPNQPSTTSSVFSTISIMDKQLTLTKLLKKASSAQIFDKASYSHNSHDDFLSIALRNLIINSTVNPKNQQVNNPRRVMRIPANRTNKTPTASSFDEHSEQTTPFMLLSRDLRNSKQTAVVADISNAANAAVKFLSSLPSITTPRQKLKARRRNNNNKMNQNSKNAPPPPFAHPRIHAMTTHLSAIAKNSFWSKKTSCDEAITDREMELLLSCSRSSILSKTQFFSPITTPHQLTQSNDRFSSYAIPGSSSMIRSDISLGHAPHCTQRLISLRDRGIQVREMTLQSNVTESLSEWCAFLVKPFNWYQLPPAVSATLAQNTKAEKEKLQVSERKIRNGYNHPHPHPHPHPLL